MVSKKESRHRPLINLKILNQCIPYTHFKMEGLVLLKEKLQEGDYMCKIDLKEAYFSVLTNFQLSLLQKSQKNLSFKWNDLFYHFFCMCFSLGPASNYFTKLMQIPISLLTKLYVQLGRHGNQLSRHDLDPSKRKKEGRATVLGSSGKIISFHKGNKPIHWPPL